MAPSARLRGQAAELERRAEATRDTQQQVVGLEGPAEAHSCAARWLSLASGQWHLDSSVSRAWPLKTWGLARGDVAQAGQAGGVADIGSIANVRTTIPSNLVCWLRTVCISSPHLALLSAFTTSVATGIVCNSQTQSTSQAACSALADIPLQCQHWKVLHVAML